MASAKTLPSVPNQINVVIEWIFLMQKTAYSLFGLLAIFSLIAVAPSAFGDHASVTVTILGMKQPSAVASQPGVDDPSALVTVTLA